METHSVKRTAYRLIDFVSKNKLETALLVAILVVGAFLRLYKIDQYMTFLGDEGRDVIIVRRLLVYFDPILIGPGTSVGNMYLGPLYYYLMAPALFLAGYSPVGPAVLVAVLAIATIWLVWWVGREWFPTSLKLRGASGLIAAGLYAISPTVIIYSRSSWNPNIMPFFAILCIYSIWSVWQKKQYFWLIVTGVSYAFVLQSHYLGLLLAPVLFLFWLISRVPAKYTLIAGVLFLFLMSPLLLFDIRHNWMNTKAFYKFLTVRQETVSIKPWKAIPKAYPIFVDINISLLTGKNMIVGKIVTVGTVLFLAWYLIFKRKLKLLKKSLFILLTWLGFALLGLSLYKQEIYDHYYGFFFPAPFLLFGVTVSSISKIDGKKAVGILLMMGLAVLTYINLINSPIKFSPNMQLQRSKAVAGKIAEESGGERFNLAVVAERNYEDGYQYFLEKDGLPVVDIDAQIPGTVTNQLFVVCEMVKEKCDPTHSAKAEVANFGWSKIENRWEVMGVAIYKLVHTK